MAPLSEWLATLAATPLARALVGSSTLYLLVNAAHVMGIGLLFGSVIALDLRLIGWARALPIAPAAVYLSRLAAAGLTLAIVTGLCLFSVRPMEYAGNPAFLAKLALVGLGLANILAVHASAGWRGVRSGREPGIALRLGATLSILIWGGAIVAGRWIGFL